MSNRANSIWPTMPCRCRCQPTRITPQPRKTWAKSSLCWHSVRSRKPRGLAQARHRPRPNKPATFCRNKPASRHKFLSRYSYAFYFLFLKHVQLNAACFQPCLCNVDRSEEHTSELQSLMRISYAVFCLKKKKQTK